MIDPVAGLMVTSVAVPLALATWLWILRLPDRMARGGLVLGASWVLVTVLPVNALAVELGWWRYDPGVPSVVSMPIPLLIGWVLLWGIAAPLVAQPTGRTVVALGIADLVLMPLLAPAVMLESGWLWGELVMLVVVAAPAVALARAQAVRRMDRLAARLLGQVVLFTLVLLVVVPAVMRGSWSPPLTGVVVALPLLAVAAAPGIGAVVEFWRHEGTPWPWDHTTRPIRSGPYRYLRSPMQASGAAVLAAQAAAFWSWELLLAAAISLSWSAWFCRSESVELSGRWGSAWSTLALAQRRWIPSWRPADGGEPGSSTGGRYTRADGLVETGLSARALAAEHRTFLHAVPGWWFGAVRLVGQALLGAGVVAHRSTKRLRTNVGSPEGPGARWT